VKPWQATRPAAQLASRGRASHPASTQVPIGVLSNRANVVRSILTALEDKRVLYEYYDFEIKDHVRQSLINIRAVLTDSIARISDKSPAAQAFRVMRAACREFLTQPHSDPLIGKAVSRLIVPPPGDPSLLFFGLDASRHALLTHRALPSGSGVETGTFPLRLLGVGLQRRHRLLALRQPFSP
jgi:hypothetical protein